MQSMNSADLNKLSAKTLKEYIHAYNLPANTAIEKSDLIKIIFNTRPISNDNECYYRRNRTRSTIKNSDNNSFSFSNLVQDIFSPNSSSEQQQTQQQTQQQERQRQQQEQLRQQQQRQQQEQLRQQQQRQQQEQFRQQQQRQQAERERLERQQREQFLRQQQQRQQSYQNHSPFSSNASTPQQAPSPSQSPPLSSDNLLSLHDMVKANIDPASLSVRTLKSILKANFVEQSHVIEKSELVKLVKRLADQHKADMQTRSAGEEGEGGGSNDDTLCRICFDAQQNCVFLDCGHMVTCMECAKKLIVTKNECPICREPIIKLVHVFRS